MKMRVFAWLAVVLAVCAGLMVSCKKEDGLEILDEALQAEQYGVGFKLGDTKLRDAVQATLKEMAKDGTAAKISATWFEGENKFVMSADAVAATPNAAGVDPSAAGFVFKVGLDATFKPYGFKNEKGEIVGFDIDLAKEVAKRRGWKIELKSIDWDAKDAELSSGMINCIWNGFTINGREKQYTWTEAYVNNSQVVMVRKGSGIKKLSDLAGKVVVVQKDSSGAAAINDEKNDALKKSLKAVRSVPEFNTALMELRQGSCDAVIIDQGVAEMHLKGKQ